MANIIKNLTGLTKESLFQLTNNLSFTAGCNREYDKNFAVEGAKIGNYLNVKKMKNSPVTKGPVLVIQPVEEETIPIEISSANQYQIGFEFNNADLSLSVEEFVKKTNLDTKMQKLANEIDTDGLKMALKVGNQVGTPGVQPGFVGGAGLTMTTSPNIFLNASAVLSELGTPDSDRSVILTPLGMASSTAGLSGLLAPTEVIGEQYRKGRIRQALDLDFAQTANVARITCGTRTNGTMNGITAEGATTINVTGLGAGGTIAAGEKFTITGVNSVNPLKQSDTGIIQSFCNLTAVTANAAGQATLNIFPKISVPSATNANGTVATLPLAGAVVTFSGTASTTYPLNMCYHKDAFTLTSVDLPMVAGADKCVRQVHKGLSMTVWNDSDITNYRQVCRIDIMAVWTAIRPETACVIWGA